MPAPDQLTTDDRVAVLVADGLEEVEALAVVDLLYRAGIGVDMLAVGDDLEVTSSHRVTFRCDATCPTSTWPTTPSSSCRAVSPAPRTSRAPGR